MMLAYKKFLAILMVTAIMVLSSATVSAQGPDGTPPAPPDGNGGQPPSGDGQQPPDGGQPPSGGQPSSGGGMPGGDGTNPVLTADCGAYLLDGQTDVAEADQSYDSTTADVSSICAINGSSLTLTNPTITKTGDTSSSDSSSFYGLNAAVLAGSGSSVTITGGTVTTDGEGTNGVFATGEDASVTLSDMTITAVGDGAHAVMATLGGTMTLTNVDMVTTDTHSGAVATDRGSGTITVTGGTVLTSGADSPGIYSTGVITVTDAVVTATGAESAVIEGANSIILTDTDLSSSLEDKWGVMIYQSMSGDAEGNEGVFTMTGGSLANTAETGPLFFITNTTAIITLSGVEATAGSGILIDAHATDRWGNSGTNGGTVNFTAENQALEGDVIADNISSINLTLQNGSSLSSAINADNTALVANLTLDDTSTWNVTADSHLTCLTVSDVNQITSNGFTITYDAASCSDLGGQTYTLDNGGVLTPVE